MVPEAMVIKSLMLKDVMECFLRHFTWKIQLVMHHQGKNSEQ